MSDRPPDRPPTDLNISEAAEQLGISKNAVRMRIRRGTLTGYKGDDGRWYVKTTTEQTDQVTNHRPTAITSTVETSEAKLQDGITTHGSTSIPRHKSASDELVNELRDRVGFLESELEARRGTDHRPTYETTLPDELVNELRDRVRFLETEVESRRESERELRVMIAQQSAQLVELAVQIRALTSGEDATDTPTDVSESTEPVDMYEHEDDDRTDQAERNMGIWGRLRRVFLGGE